MFMKFILQLHEQQLRFLLLWIARQSGQSILKEINPDYSLEGLMLKFGHLKRKADSSGKTLMLGKTEGRRKM